MKLRTLALAAPLALSACSPYGGQNDRICTKPPDILASAAQENRMVVAEGCVHRWAYRLARDRSAHARTAAQAVVGLCRDTVVGVAAQLEEPVSASERRYESIALGYVVQARAGDCDVP